MVSPHNRVAYCMRAMGCPMQLLLLLFGLALSSPVASPEPPSNPVAAEGEEGVSDLTKEFMLLRKKFTDLRKKFADLKNEYGVGTSQETNEAGSTGLEPEESASLNQSATPNGQGWRRVPVELLFASQGRSIQYEAPTSADTEGNSGENRMEDQVAWTPSPTAASDQNDGYSLWRVDVLLRPCLGTKERKASRVRRTDLPTGGFRKRLSAILADVSASGVPINTQAFAWYNMVNKQPKTFMIRFIMHPAVYKYVYMQHYKHVIPPAVYERVFQQSFATAQMIFEDEYYGDRLLKLYQANQTHQAVLAGHNGSRMLRAHDDIVAETGSVLLFNAPKPFAVEELTDDVMDSVEAAVVDAFKDHPDKHFWYSICLVPLPADTWGRAKFLIGSKVEEDIFARVLPAPLQETFLAANEYKDSVWRQDMKEAAKSPKRQIVQKQAPSNVYYSPTGYRNKKYEYFPKV